MPTDSSECCRWLVTSSRLNKLDSLVFQKPAKAGFWFAFCSIFRYYLAMFNYDFLSSKWAVFCLLALVIFAVFGQAVWFDYVQLDEGILLVNNRFFISDISNVFEAFKHDINYPSNIAPYYRPMFILSFMLNAQVGSSPLAYHVGNILLHIIAVYFVFLFFRELGHKKEISLLASLLFAVHPAVTPVVAWVPGRIEAILAIFTLLSFILFIRFLKANDWRYLAGFFLSFTIALFTKEVAIALISVLLFYYLIHRKEAVDNRHRKSVIHALLGLAVIITVWFFVRRNIIAGAQITDLSFFQMIAALWSNYLATLLYLGKTILPFNLTALPVLESSTIVCGLIILVVLVIYWIVDKIKVLSVSALGILWFIAFLAPSLVSYYQPDRMVFFEHRLYLPLLGIIIFVAGSDWVNRLDFKKIKIIAPATAIVVLFSAFAFNYSGVYRDKMSFWQMAVADSPRSSIAHSNLATAYLIDGKTEEAMAEFEKTLELNPKEKRIHLLLGLFYLNQGMHDKAKMEFEKEIDTDPYQFVAYHGLGRIYAQKRNMKEAEKYFLKTVEINPDYVLARQDLVVLYFSQNKHPLAIAQLKELLRVQRPEAMNPKILKILETYAKEAAFQKGF